MELLFLEGMNDSVKMIIFIFIFIFVFIGGVAANVYLELWKDKKRNEIIANKVKEMFIINKPFGLVYVECENQVIDDDSLNLVFNTLGFDDEVINNIVDIWNSTGMCCTKCLYSGGTVDDYLLNEPNCSQEQREFIVESLYNYARNKFK